VNRAIGCSAILLVLLLSCSDDKNPGPPAGDTTPPARVIDLTVRNAVGSTVTLGWTAPGGDGFDGQASQYDLRYSQASLTGAGWDTATVARSLPTPKAAGQPDSLTITDLASGEWFFALKTADEVPNWSAISNVADATVVDTIPPGAVTDLTAVSTGFASLRLSWTAPGNDGTTGRASEYDLRRALAPITEETWDDAIRVEGLPRPALSGVVRSLTVTGLELATDHFFALRTADGVPNWSALSNVVSRSTLSASFSRLTYSAAPFGVGMPQLSPDGQTILFQADWETSPAYAQLYLIPAEGGDAVRLTDEPVSAYFASWSPDGSQIAFVSRRSNPDLVEVFVMGATPGAQPAQLTHHGLSNMSGCAWSPDGTRIAYGLMVSMNPWSTDLYLIPSAGGTPERITGGGSGFNAWPAWSPDGTRIAFSSDRTGNLEIFVVPAEGGVPVQLTDDPGWDLTPAWSPDGSQIAFSSNRAGNDDIWVMSADGGSPTPLTSDPASEGAPTWSPDGTRIAFARSTSEQISDIWILTGQEAAQP
jgi:Tol biopolymer transport system component